MLDKDDRISGKKLWGLSSAPLKRLNVGNLGRTSSHPGQDQTLNGNFCYLEIIDGWKGLPLPRHPRDEITQIPFLQFCNNCRSTAFSGESTFPRWSTAIIRLLFELSSPWDQA